MSLILYLTDRAASGEEIYVLMWNGAERTDACPASVTAQAQAASHGSFILEVGFYWAKRVVSPFVIIQTNWETTQQGGEESMGMCYYGKPSKIIIISARPIYRE